MAITLSNLKFFASERLTDEDDGGGRMGPTEIVSGVENSVFDDISDVDRAAGGVSVRKVYSSVTSEDTDKYLDACVAVFRAPADPNVAVLATSTGDFYDERSDIQSYIESYLVRGPRSSLFLYGTQIVGGRAISFFGREEDEPPSINTTLLLLEFTSNTYTTESYSQYVRIVRITKNEVEPFEDEKGKYFKRIIACEISDALKDTYHGAEVARETSIKPLALIYSCVVADAARYYGIRPLVTDAETGDLSVYADAIYDRIVPTSQVESPILDFNAAAERTFAAAAAGSTISFTVGDTFSANFALYVGRAIVPGSLTIAVSGGTLSDDGGDLKSGTVSVGSVSYTDGLVTFAIDSPSYTGTKTITFTPAAALTRASNSFGIPITENTRYRTYVANLKPTPNRGTLVVDYMSQGNWYRLSDDGNGILTGASESYGAGTVNFSTGSVSLTLGAYPDVYSSIIFTYGSGQDSLPVNQTGVFAIQLNFDLTRLVPGSVALAWGAITLDTDNEMGWLTGTGGFASIDYTNGSMLVTPDTLPAKDTVFTLTADQYGETESFVETFTPTANGNGEISLTLANQDVNSGSVVLSYIMEVNADELPEEAIYHAPDLITTKTVRIRDNGQGNLKTCGTNTTPGATVGTINYAAGTLTLDTDGAFLYGYKPIFVYTSRLATYWDGSQWQVRNIVEKTFSHYESITVIGGTLKVGSTVSVSYSQTNTPAPVNDTATLSTLTTTVSRPSGEWQYVPGSVRFTIGSRTYQDQLSRMVYGFNPATGTGTDAGSFSNGTLVLSDWPAVTNSYTQSAGLVRQNLVLVSRAVFRTASAPVAVGSFSFRVNIYGTNVLEGSADDKGEITGSVVTGYYGTTTCSGKFDYQTGVAEVYFGKWVTAAGNENQPWYDADAVYSGQILMPQLVALDTLLYNCVTYQSLPLDSNIIGLDPVRLPGDGKVPIFRDGQLVLIHHTDTITENSLSPTQVIDCGRVRLYRVTVTDVNGNTLSPEYYTLDRVLGTVTMKQTLDLTGLTAPYSINHTVADLSVITDADLSGRINLSRAISHDYPKDESRISGLLYVGTLQARVTKLFAQSTWTSVWSDSLIGSEPLAQYNDAQYPIAVTNKGAYPDRFLVKFTSSTAFQVIGENLGIIGVGDINNDCAPLNSLTGNAYFTIDKDGWGAGWATGNCLRFNVVSAAYPVDLIRAIQPSDPSGLDTDSVELILVGNVDA